ncbi:hypothetical protein HAX54_038867 [Datura stramonium]|uniref:Protein FAR1-RELATED SEQUENCE n=1 Tax=Datura stramonium TaxID=4076 RepID=A0ABS8SIN8_DATST|nr:hypothetical protein [Datura stramonium]
MENEVIEFDIGLGGGGGSEDGDGDDVLDEENVANCSSVINGNVAAVQSYSPEGDLDLEPYEGMKFESEESAKAFYNSYARRVGFSTRVSSSLFRVTNVLTLPSHYILKRWSRSAKSSVALEDRVADVINYYLESHTVRYNMLRHEAFKFVEEGAETVDSYTVAIAALEEASKKVSLAVKYDGRISLVNGHCRENLARNGVCANYNIEDEQRSLACPLFENMITNCSLVLEAFLLLLLWKMVYLTLFYLTMISVSPNSLLALILT